MISPTDSTPSKTAYRAIALEARAFEGVLAFLAFASGLLVVLWFIASNVFGLAAIPSSLNRFAAIVIGGWFVFNGLKALIAFALTTAVRLVSEWFAVVAEALADGLTERPAPIGQEGNVTYLAGMLKGARRTHDSFEDGAS